MRTTRTKICGITRLEDAEQAVEAGAWAVGTILWPGSKRACEPGEAARVAARLKRRAEVVGVFVNQPLDEVCGMAEAIGLTAVQLHGDEGLQFCTEVQRRTGAKVIKAGRVRAAADVQALTAFRTVDFLLPDAHVEGQWGGTGQTIDWQLARSLRSPVPVLLSGGLTPENVGEAVRTVRPYGVDVASGTDAEPGVKDPDKVSAFLAAVREADEQLDAEKAAREAAKAAS